MIKTIINVAVLIFGIFGILIKREKGRSMQSRLFELLLRANKNKFTTKEEVSKFLEKKESTESKTLPVTG